MAGPGKQRHGFCLQRAFPLLQAFLLAGRNQPDSFYLTEAMPLPPLPRTYESASRSKAYVLKVSLTSQCVGFIVYNSIGPLQGWMGPRGRNACLCGCPAQQEAGILHSVTGACSCYHCPPCSASV